MKARLRLARRWPALPASENHLDIWMDGARFRVRDESGREANAILRDVSAARGLGAPPHSMEEIMDEWTQTLKPAVVATELRGDLVSGAGEVCRVGQRARPVPAAQLAPAARQILVDETELARLEKCGPQFRLGRPATEYRGCTEGADEGVPYRSIVTLLVSPPYLLLRSVRDAQNGNHYYTREIVALEEGAVSGRELNPA